MPSVSVDLQAVVVKELVKINETLVELLRRTSTLAPRVPSLPSWIIQNYRFVIKRIFTN